MSVSKMSNAQFHNSVDNDPDNSSNYRSRNNTPRSLYNCGGYALSTYTWVLPCIRSFEDFTDYQDWTLDELQHFDDFEHDYTDGRREALMVELLNNGYSVDDACSVILKWDVKFLLLQFPFLREINPNGVSQKNRLIAYRVHIRYDSEYNEIYSDFHFKVRIGNCWSEKCGRSNIHKCKLMPNRVWRCGADLEYRGKIAYLFDTRHKK